MAIARTITLRRRTGKTWYADGFQLIRKIMAVTKVSSSLHFVARKTGAGAVDGSITGRWTPNTDVYSVDANLVVKVELAGMKNDSLEITVEGQRLRISGEREDGCRPPHCTFLVMEISYGPFETVLDLPAGFDLSQAKATYVNGFLRIEVPGARAPQINTTKVPVTDGV
jgi:HSP20 family molecular chaperone IbpA